MSRFLLLCLLLASQAAPAGDYAIGFNPRTGDAWFDARLGEINVAASGNLDGFIDEVVVSTRAPRVWVETLVVERRYPPADVYMLAESAYRGGVSFDTALTVYEQHRGEGWGAMAKRLGIKPGSAEFHAMKQGSARNVGAVKASKGKPASAGGGNSQSKGKAKGKGKNKD
jgi:hypothetical protein